MATSTPGVDSNCPPLAWNRISAAPAVLASAWATNHAGGRSVRPLRFTSENSAGTHSSSAPSSAALWRSGVPAMRVASGPSRR